MSYTDLSVIIEKLRNSLSFHPGFDLGYVLTLAGLAILGFFAAIIAGSLLLWLTRRIADMEPWQFAKTVFILGLILFIAGILAP